MATGIVGALETSGQIRMAWIAGSVIALIASVCLLLGVEFRAWRLASRLVVQQLFRWHDGLMIVQSLLLIPFAVGVSRVVAAPPRERLLAVLAATSLITMAVLMLLWFLRVMTFGPADSWYMLPQAVLGLWVIAISRRLSSRSVAVFWVGIAAGVGLLLIAASLLAVMMFAGPAAMSGTIRDRSATVQLVNQIGHITLRAGAYLGRLGFPIWALLIGRRHFIS
jgi:hypothetical protein